MKHKYALYPIIMSICAFVCFLAVAWLFSYAVQPRWGWTMLLLLPAVVLAFVALPAAKGKLKETTTFILTTALVVILLPASGFYTVILGFLTSEETTDIRYYTRAYEVIEDEDGVEGIFPKKIPADAKDIEFSYMPQALQRGEVFELSYTTTEEKLTEWKTLLTREAEWIGSNKEWHEANHWGFHDEDSVRYHLDWDGGYNHGEWSYVLIDEDANRITFFYEDW